MTSKTVEKRLNEIERKLPKQTQIDESVQIESMIEFLDTYHEIIVNEARRRVERGTTKREFIFCVGHDGCSIKPNINDALFSNWPLLDNDTKKVNAAYLVHCCECWDARMRGKDYWQKYQAVRASLESNGNKKE